MLWVFFYAFLDQFLSKIKAYSESRSREKSVRYSLECFIETLIDNKISLVIMQFRRSRATYAVRDISTDIVNINAGNEVVG